MKKLFLCIIVLLSLSAFGDIGNQSDETSTDYIDQYINVSRFQASSNMTIAVVNAKILGITGRYKLAIYSGNSTGPTQLIGTTEQAVDPSTGWYSFPLLSTVSLTNGQYYWFASWSDTVGARVYCSTSGGMTRWESSSRAYGTWPNTLTMNASSSSFNYCIYAPSVSVTNPPPPVTNVFYASVTLAWDPSPDATVIGYRIYHGIASGIYTNTTSFGNVTNASITNLIVGPTYFFAATAYDANGNESVFSNETSYTPPPPTNSIYIPFPAGLRVIKK